MSKEVLETREFIRGAARLRDLVYIVTKDRNLLKRDIAHASVLGIYRGQWGDAVDGGWNSTAIAVARQPQEKLVLIGEEGDVATYVGGKSAEETIMPEPVMIRNARTIDGHVYACGMKRQVYRRAGEAQWIDISAPRAKDLEELGFEALDGFTEQEIYAAGWGGEIWTFDGSNWTEQCSPSNVILSAVCCAGDGQAYIAGQRGVLVKGRHDVWDTVQWEDEVSADLWDLCWYRDKLYVATMQALYTLNGNTLQAVDMGRIGPVSCYSLSTAEDVLWSIGQKDVVSFDGKQWKKYT
ncbi:hypothetical protein SAMN05518865_108108 [Duganella sp. CF458]|uniref:hypothetical protein n=1 Tax=Duganella sp. CF458 TaxID=1884368 RepID=UPI0008F32CD0|nr:hypothetical protein [Duganella sp. CF458]SFG09693.1 hypothetical protein SAMN05518865_108108 [Duganella sp. CF458]